MKLVRPPVRYDTLDDFHRYDERRADSPTVEFGSAWTESDESGWTFPRSRLAWIEATGELIVVRGTRFVPRDPNKLPVKVVAIVDGREAIEEVLEGWRFHHHSEGLGWVYRRLEVAARGALA